jgi:hypothetical protein
MLVSAVIFVWHNFDVELPYTLQLSQISEGFMLDIIQSIRQVGDQFTEESFFVGVQSDDDQAHQRGSFGLEGKSFNLSVHLNFFRHLPK